MCQAATSYTIFLNGDVLQFADVRDERRYSCIGENKEIEKERKTKAPKRKRSMGKHELFSPETTCVQAEQLL